MLIFYLISSNLPSLAGYQGQTTYVRINNKRSFLGKILTQMGLDQPQLGLRTTYLKGLQMQRKKQLKMEHKWNKLQFCFTLTILMLLIAIYSCSSNESSINDHSIKKIYSEKLKGLEVISKNYDKQLNFSILNNPFEIDESYKLFILFNDELVYSGPFKLNGNIQYSKSNLQVPIRPTVYLKRNMDNYIYYFPLLTTFELTVTDRYLNIVFCPSNDNTSVIYFIPTSKSVL
jgi:hypothetical protein